MLSYQHGYHAGNFADVLKHIVLINILEYLKQKDKPICYIDTHAGRGGYFLATPEGLKNQEYLTGISKIMSRLDLPGGVANYVAAVRGFNQEKQLTYYPGSPRMAASILRQQDRLFCYELHPGEFIALHQSVQGDKRIKVFQADGFNECLGLLPPKERRGLILIDPSYELKTDYEHAVNGLQHFYKRFPSGCYLLWYPVVSRRVNRAIERQIKLSGIKNVLLVELAVKPDTPGFGMTASGLIVINPPWTLFAELQQLMPWLTSVLEQEQGVYRIEQLIPE